MIGRSEAGRKVTGHGMHRSLEGRHFFALALGSIVGSAWVVVMGDWLEIAAPGGALVGFLLGGAAISVIGLCYAALAASIPAAGGELVYAFEVFGQKVAFAVGWFTTLLLISATVFEGIAIALLLEALIPNVLGPTLYAVGGHDVRLGSLLVGFTGAAAITWINYCGVRAAAIFQAIVTVLFLSSAIIIMIIAISLGSIRNLEPMFPDEVGVVWWKGALWIFATSPFWLNGFQAVSQAIEERAPKLALRKLGWIIVGSIVVATAFYLLVIVAVAMAAPWQRSAAQPMASAYAMRDLVPHGLLSRLVLLTAIVSLVKTWNGIALTAARMLLSQGRAHFLPPQLARIHPRYGSPFVAVLCVGAFNAIGTAFGRGAILPIIETVAISIGFTYVVVCLATLRRRAQNSLASECHVPGGTPVILLALSAALAMAGYALLQPIFDAPRGFPVQWLLLILWASAGAACWCALSRQRTKIGMASIRENLLRSAMNQ